MSSDEDNRGTIRNETGDKARKGAPTAAYGESPLVAKGAARRFRLVVIEGPARGVTWQSSTDRCAIGSQAGNDLVIDDTTVSRFHCEVVLDESKIRVRDLGSRNGTVVDGVSIMSAFLRAGSLLRLGKTVLRFELGTETNRLPISEESEFGSLKGTSPVMRSAFAILARAAQSDATVLLEGETGTGKSQAAHSVHRKSARAQGPFVIVDCGAIQGNLLESELFGHEKGSFTGAADRRIGAFEEASGGTLFLDEIGELSMDLQPKLLRALEAREVRRIGANAHVPIDVRVIAATNRDLRADVNSGRFRADLYFRLAVVTIAMPPLRQRPQDIPTIAEEIMTSLRPSPEALAAVRTPEFMAQLRYGAWPGNVRELRNYIERCLILCSIEPAGEQVTEASSTGIEVDPRASYASERERVIAAFEKRYIEGLLQLHGGKIGKAAEASGLDRTYFYRLARRHRTG